MPGSTQQQAASDDYMQPIDEGTTTPKYDSGIISKCVLFYCASSLLLVFSGCQIEHLACKTFASQSPEVGYY